MVSIQEDQHPICVPKKENKNERRKNKGGNNLKNIERNVQNIEESRGSSNSKSSMNTD